jgi:hypothetical protein
MCSTLPYHKDSLAGFYKKTHEEERETLHKEFKSLATGINDSTWGAKELEDAYFHI